jgi:ubiquinone/menaquinone biosynthesis C-methylase UbiE
LRARPEEFVCEACHSRFPVIAGIPDLRTKSDRYLTLAADRVKAQRLARMARTTDLAGLAKAYYAMTHDLGARQKARFQAHIARAEERATSMVSQIPDRGSILEIGCGSGGFITAAARLRRRVAGVDVALRWLIAARRRLDDAQLDAPLVAAAGEALPWASSSFDAVVADSVLEHSANPTQLLRECWRVLKPGGLLLLWSPNRFSCLPDPHVGLWGLGFLPRRWANRYVRWRRGAEWTIQPISARRCASWLARDTWSSVTIEPAPLPPSMGHSWLERLGLALYNTVRILPVARSALCAIGPVWQSRAIKGEAA